MNVMEVAQSIPDALQVIEDRFNAAYEMWRKGKNPINISSGAIRSLQYETLCLDPPETVTQSFRFIVCRRTIDHDSLSIELLDGNEIEVNTFLFVLPREAGDNRRFEDLPELVRERAQLFIIDESGQMHDYTANELKLSPEELLKTMYVARIVEQPPQWILE